MRNRIKNILYSLGFATILSLISIPPMICIHLLARDESPYEAFTENCRWLEQKLLTVRDTPGCYRPFAE
jgi:hypothetical protein